MNNKIKGLLMMLPMTLLVVYGIITTPGALKSVSIVFGFFVIFMLGIFGVVEYAYGKNK